MAPHRRNRRKFKNRKKNAKKNRRVVRVNKQRETLTVVQTNAVVAENDRVEKHDCKVVDQPVVRVKEEPPIVEQKLSFILESQIQAQIKTEKLDPIERMEELGGGVKRKRLMKIEKVDYDEERYIKQEPANDVERCMKSCVEDVTLLVSNVPRYYTLPDVVRLFSQYNSLQCSYMVDNNCDTSGKSLAKAVLIFNNRLHAKQVMNNYNGLLLDGCCDVALKIELISSMRRCEYESPLNLIHYQVVKSPSMFKRTFNLNRLSGK